MLTRLFTFYVMTREKGSLEYLFWAKTIPTPGVEPGPSGWKPDILAVRPRGIIQFKAISKYIYIF